MDKIVRKLRNKKAFVDALEARRASDKADFQLKRRGDDFIPVFNSKLFSAHSGVVITGLSRKIMKENGKNLRNLDYRLSTSEVRSMTPVIDGLHVIHQGINQVKHVLAHAVTMETYEAHQHINKLDEECRFSCYFVLHGSVEATYDHTLDKNIKLYESNIVYSHGAGECVGLVNYEGQERDISPPSSLYASVPCQVIRVDRRKFHSMVKSMSEELRKEKHKFLTKGKGFLSQLNLEDRLRLGEMITKVDFSPDEIVLSEEEISNYVYFIGSGHFQCCTKVKTRSPDQESAFFDLGLLAEGDIFGQECLSNLPSRCYVFSASIAGCYRLNRDDAILLRKEPVYVMLKSHESPIPTDEIIKKQAGELDAWNLYKSDLIETCLQDSQSNKLVKGRKRAKSSFLERREKNWNFVVISGAQGRRPIDDRIKTADSSDLRTRRKCSIDPMSFGLDYNCESPREQKKKIDAREMNRLFADSKPTTRLSRSYSLLQVSDKANAGLLILDSSEMVLQAERDATSYRQNVERRRLMKVKDDEWRTDIHKARSLAKEQLYWDRYRMALITLKLRRLRHNNNRS